MASHYQQAGPSSSYYIEQQPQAPQNYGAEYSNNVYAPGPSNPNGYNPVQHQPQQQYNAGPGPGMSSPRLNGRGGGGAGYHLNPAAQAPRGRGAHPQYAPHINNYRPPYPQQPQPPYAQHQHPAPHHMQPSLKYPAPQHAYAPYPVGVMYAPPPPQGAWGQPPPPQQQQQAPHQLSPLPKQDLPLPSPLVLGSPRVGPVYTYPSVPTPLPAAPVSQNQNEGNNELNEGQNQNTAPPDTAAVAVSDTREEELESDAVPPSASASASVSSALQPEPISTPPPPSSEPSRYGYGQISAPTSTSASPPTSPSHSHSQSIYPASSSSSAPTSHSDGWAIWSRRPRDPAHAPGVIISPRARPPPDVVASARAGGTPPPSPPPVPVGREGGEVVEGAMDGRVEEGAEEVEAPAAADADADADTPSSSTDYTDTRTTGTPVTTATTVPGSPLSSATSVSMSIAKAAEPAASTSASSPSPDAVEPQPAVPAAPPPKKSWASLLRPAASPAASTAAAAGPQNGKQKLGGLPTSSVVGFSIPAAGPGSGAAESVGKNHAALRALLSAPAADATAAAPKSFADASASAAPTASEKTQEERLTPRGLVNTGNMCFANAVLQVLVYCAPFSSLFARLHALLGEAEFDVAGAGAGGFNTNPSGGQDDGGGGGGVLGAAPLVRATGAFLREFVVSVSAKKPVNGGAGGKGKGKVSPAEEQEEEPEAFIPTHIYDALKGKKRFDGMRGGHQEDAEEFLGFFLDTLEEELLAVATGLSPAAAPASKRVTATLSADGTGRAVVEEREEEAPPETEDGWLEVGRKNRTVVTRTVKSAESPITRIFGGRFRSTLRAPGQKDSVIVEDWRSLRLDIQRDGIHTIADALALISHPQTVQMSHPSRPGIVVDASQQILIDALPPILILHVKRFCYDTAVGGVVKVGKRVAFGPELEVGNEVLVPTARKQPVRYKLFGVVYHHGVSASGGHYTLDVLHPTRFPGSATGTGSEREGWVRIDDELVSDVRPVDVFGAPEGDSRCAYLLFYRRGR